MLKLRNLSKKYGDFEAVKQFDLDVKPGSIFGFIGPNGAGKTTTIKMITGISSPTSGEVFIDNINMQENPLDAKKKIAYVPDSPDAFLKLSAMEYFHFIGNIYDIEMDTRMQRINHYSKLLELDSVLHDSIASFSHGMRQKTFIIGALLHDPYVLILDEPLTGLDPKSSYTLKEIMRQRAEEGKIVFFSTHVLEVAEKLCHQIAIINHGNIQYHGSLEDLKSQFPEQSLETIFLEMTSHV